MCSHGPGATARRDAWTTRATSSSRLPAAPGRETAPIRRPPGPPRHGVRARSGEPLRPARGAHRRRRRRRLGARREGRRSAPTTASGSRRPWRSRTTPPSSTARSSSSSRCPRSRGSTARRRSTRRSSRGVCWSTSTGRATGPSRSGCAGSAHTFLRLALGPSRRRRDDGRAADRAVRRARRPLGRGHRQGPAQRDQGARTAALAARHSSASVPARRPRRWRQPKRDPSRCGATSRCGPRRGGLPGGDRRSAVGAAVAAPGDGRRASTLTVAESEGADAADGVTTQRALDLLRRSRRGVISMSPGSGCRRDEQSLTVATTEDGTLTLGVDDAQRERGSARRRPRDDASARAPRRRRVEVVAPTRRGRPDSTRSSSRTAKKTYARLFGAARGSRSSTAASSAPSSDRGSLGSR